MNSIDFPNRQNHNLRFGMIGCGALGLLHAQRLNGIENVSIAAVSDPDMSAMQRVASVVPRPESVQLFSDYAAMLEKTDLDAVVISSPNPWHVEQLLASLEHGLDVLCEKPLSMLPEEVERVVEATEKSGRTVAIAYQSRYRRDSRLLRLALESGKWGNVTSVNILSTEDWVTGNIGTWRHDPKRCPGGFFVDANGHQLDLLFWLTGMEASEVRATISTRGTPVPIVTWGEARLVREEGRGKREEGEEVRSERENSNPKSKIQNPKSVPLTFLFVGDGHGWREEISIQTEKADFLLRDTRLFWTESGGELLAFTEADLGIEEKIINDTPDTAFVTALRGGAPVSSPPETVWPVLNFTLGALESAEFHLNGSV